MVAYSFKKRFAEPILLGTKRQTIRADRKRHARPGEQLQLYVGQRTRHCRLLAKPICESVEKILLCWETDTIFRVESGPGFYRSRTMSRDEAEAFARADGFADLADMKAFWQAEHPGAANFSGVVIRWHPLPESEA